MDMEDELKPIITVTYSLFLDFIDIKFIRLENKLISQLHVLFATELFLLCHLLLWETPAKAEDVSKLLFSITLLC